MKKRLVLALVGLVVLYAACSERKVEAPPKPKTQEQLVAAACMKEAFTAHLQTSQALLKESMAVVAGGGDDGPLTLLLRHEKEAYCMRHVECANPPELLRSALLESCLAETI